MLYYRRDLLEAAGFSGPPRIWDELKEQAKKVVGDGGARDGFVFQGANYEGGVCNGLEYIWSHGGDVVEGGKAVADSPETVAGLATHRSMVAEGVAPEAVATYKEDETAGAFLRGGAVFARNWSYLYGLTSDPAQSQVKPEQVGIVKIPAARPGGESHGVLGASTLVINAATDKQGAAYEFIEYMAASQQQKLNLLRGSFLPVLKSLYEDEKLLREEPVMALGKEALL
jgi:multiple sugar transport system substrate-binding protein